MSLRLPLLKELAVFLAYCSSSGFLRDPYATDVMHVSLEFARTKGCANTAVRMGLCHSPNGEEVAS